MSKESLKADITQLGADYQAAYDACCAADWALLAMQSGNPNIKDNAIAALKALEDQINAKIKEYDKL